MRAIHLIWQQDESGGISAAWWAVVSRFLLHGLILSTWASRIPAIQSSLHLSNAALGLCLLGTAVGSVISIPATSWLIRRFGSKVVTVWTTVGLSTTLLAPCLASSPATLFAALMIIGALAGANDVSINAQGVAVEKEMGTPTMSRFHAMFSIGGMAGASAGAVFASHAIPPRLHLIIASVLFTAIALATAPFLLEANDRGTRQSQPLSLRRMPPVVLTLAAIGFCMFLSEGAMADWTAVYIKQDLNANQGLAAAGYAVFSCGMAAVRLFGDVLTKRFGSVAVLRAGAVLAGVGLTLALTAPSASIALPGFALTGAGFSVIVPLVFAAGGRAYPGASGSGIAMISGSGYVGFLFGPPLIGLLAQASSLRSALFLLVALSAIAAVLAPAVRHGDTQRSA